MPDFGLKVGYVRGGAQYVDCNLRVYHGGLPAAAKIRQYPLTRHFSQLCNFIFIRRIALCDDLFSLPS